MKELYSILCDSSRSVCNLINSLGRVERYDATQVHCISFSKASDIVDGINVRFTNMAKGYPFNLEVSHGTIVKCCIYVANFLKIPHYIKQFKNKCAIRQVDSHPNFL